MKFLRTTSKNNFDHLRIEIYNYLYTIYTYTFVDDDNLNLSDDFSMIDDKVIESVEFDNCIPYYKLK